MTIIQQQDEIEVFINGNNGVTVTSAVNDGHIALSSLAACQTLCDAIMAAAKTTNFKPEDEDDQ